MGRGIPCASKRDNGPLGSIRNASDIAGLMMGTTGSDFCFLAGWSRSSGAGRLREDSSPSTIRPFGWRVRRYWSIRFASGPAACGLISSVVSEVP